MKIFERWKLRRKIIKYKDSLKNVKMDRRTLIISVISFVFGFMFSRLYGEKLQLSDKDVYFGDSPRYILKTDTSVFLVILIFSSINNLSRRQLIRETWLSNVGNQKIVHFFVISTGTASINQKSLLQEEQIKYSDLLIFTNLDDSFYLLTEKLIASFGWLTDTEVLHDEGKSPMQKTFEKFKYLLKCDDDSYVRVTDIVNELESMFNGKKGENLYWGFFDGRARPKKTGKYKEDMWNICDFYIPYALGGGYVLSYPLVHYIARNGNFLTRYQSEDVSVGAWLATYSQLNRVHEPRFDTEYISRGCHQSYLITHKHSEAAMKTFYENLKTTGQLCQKTFRTRISYSYNWDVPPSKCCARNNRNIP